MMSFTGLFPVLTGFFYNRKSLMNSRANHHENLRNNRTPEKEKRKPKASEKRDSEKIPKQQEDTGKKYWNNAETLKRLVEASSIGLWDWDLTTDKVRFSSVYKRQIGYEDHEIEDHYKEWESRVHPDDLEFAVNRVRNFINNPWPDFHNVFRFRHKNGTYRWILVRASLEYDKNDVPIKMLGSHQDITEQKEMETQLRDSEEKYRNLFHNIRDAILITDTQRRIVGFNRAFTDLFGYEEHELLGCETVKVYNDEAQFDEMGRRIKENPDKLDFLFTVDYRKKSGEVFPGETGVYPLTDGNGNSTGFIGVIRDVTEQLEAKAKILRSESRFRSLVENLFDGVVVVDPDGTILFVNPAACRLFERTENELVGHSFGFPVSGENASKVELYGAKGKLKYAEIKTVPVKWHDLKCMLLSIRDVTETRVAELERMEMMAHARQLQKFEALGTLAGGIAHDFNNLLSPIIGFAELEASLAEEGSELQESLGQILKASNRAKELVQQILSFTRQAEEAYHPVLMRPLLKEAVKLMKAVIPSSIEIRSQIESARMVRGNSTHIHQVVMNLCTNAQHAMEATGGILTLILSDETVTQQAGDNYADLAPGEYVRLRIEDTGPGIAPETLEKIFDPYFTTKEQGKGTGLGLSIVKGIVRNHGGMITAASKPGGGTAFDVYLPCMAKEKPSSVSRESTIETGTERILLVDDEESVARLHGRIFEKLGYSVEISMDPEEALEVFRNAPSDFDLVITDMTMPKMNGVELAAFCTEIRPDIPFIVVTGLPDRITEEEVQAAGVKDFLLKPVSREVFAGKVREVLDKKKCTQPGESNEKER